MSSYAMTPVREALAAAQAALDAALPHVQTLDNYRTQKAEARREVAEAERERAVLEQINADLLRQQQEHRTRLEELRVQEAKYSAEVAQAKARAQQELDAARQECRTRLETLQQEGERALAGMANAKALAQQQLDAVVGRLAEAQRDHNKILSGMRAMLKKGEN